MSSLIFNCAREIINIYHPSNSLVFSQQISSHKMRARAELKPFGKGRHRGIAVAADKNAGVVSGRHWSEAIMRGKRVDKRGAEGKARGGRGPTGARRAPVRSFLVLRDPSNKPSRKVFPMHTPTSRAAGEDRRQVARQRVLIRDDYSTFNSNLARRASRSHNSVAPPRNRYLLRQTSLNTPSPNDLLASSWC